MSSEKFEFDPAYFRLKFPEFSNVTTYPDATLQRFWDTAILFMSNCKYGVVPDDSRFYGLNLLTAHLLQLSINAAAGNTPSIVQSAAIDKISVGLVAPPIRSTFEFWMYTTPYGMQLLALLGLFTVGGIVVGNCVPEITSFRKAGGLF